MIEAMKGPRGQELARCTCDDCGSIKDVRAAHGKTPHGAGKLMCLAKEGQVLKKIEAAGWAQVRNALRCPTCEAKRRQKCRKEANMTGFTFDAKAALHEAQKCRKDATTMTKKNVTHLRQPTPKQKREIIGLLEDVYDDERKCYTGAETDKTVAEAIGNGVMWGWVAEIREEMFGPDGSNDEMEALLTEMRAWRNAQMKDVANARIHLENAEKTLREMDEAIKRVNEFETRQQAIMKSVGGRAAKA
ncbi:hypothetical protein RAZWK3B_15513 [Roseobacter sp. AzwK-3b]|uniref:hypothetical protein n=1 Tax=Roseobacter sp. AzwK-3b TaxID=351016 RepID=UPI000156A4E3|nr:hypothetical protein [Roseobacter sp. AzwK-3b]EDM70818.1 hypothetical protein RAZWK3B_15513 [Roseobacter sp. AzwK-3b]